MEKPVKLPGALISSDSKVREASPTHSVADCKPRARGGWDAHVICLCLLLPLFLVGCQSGKSNPQAEAPPPATVQPDFDPNNFTVAHPALFPLVTATERSIVPALNVTGVVQPDIARAVPVISLAAGRVVEIRARLGDVVKKGQLLLKVQSN